MLQFGSKMAGERSRVRDATKTLQRDIMRRSRLDFESGGQRPYLLEYPKQRHVGSGPFSLKNSSEDTCERPFIRLYFQCIPPSNLYLMPRYSLPYHLTTHPLFSPLTITKFMQKKKKVRFLVDCNPSRNPTRDLWDRFVRLKCLKIKVRHLSSSASQQSSTI